MMAPRLKPGYLPPGAAAIFDKALVLARQIDEGSVERAAVIDRAHATVRDQFPNYFRP